MFEAEAEASRPRPNLCLEATLASRT